VVLVDQVQQIRFRPTGPESIHCEIAIEIALLVHYNGRFTGVSIPWTVGIELGAIGTIGIPDRIAMIPGTIGAVSIPNRVGIELIAIQTTQVFFLIGPSIDVKRLTKSPGQRQTQNKKQN
jgi:hypothetical protein